MCRRSLPRLVGPDRHRAGVREDAAGAAAAGKADGSCWCCCCRHRIALDPSCHCFCRFHCNRTLAKKSHHHCWCRHDHHRHLMKVHYRRCRRRYCHHRHYHYCHHRRRRLRRVLIPVAEEGEEVADGDDGSDCPVAIATGTVCIVWLRVSSPVRTVALLPHTNP